MKALSIKSLVAIVVAVGLWTSDGVAESVSIPVWQGFEEMTLGALGPATIDGITYTGTLEVISWDAAEGQRSLRMSSNNTSSSLTVNVDPTESNVWTMVYTKPAFNVDEIFETMTLDDDTALVFGVDTNGSVLATDGDGWATNHAGIVADVWLGFAINADYGTGTYDLYLANDALHGSSLTRIFEELAFNTEYTNKYMTELEIVTDLEAFVDALALDVSQVEIADQEAPHVQPVMRKAGDFISPPSVGSEEYKFGRDLGAKLMAGLSEGDIIRVYFGGNTWEEYKLEKEEGVYAWGGDGDTNRVINPSQGMILVKVTNPGNKFVPHSESARTEPSADILADDWNMLAWTAPAANQNESSNWHFGHIAGENDTIIVRDGTRAHTFVWRNGAWRLWPQVSMETNFKMSENHVFWYRRLGGEATWEPEL